MVYNIYVGVVSLVVATAAALTYRFFQTYHRHVLGTRLQGKWNVFTHTFLALILTVETLHVLHHYMGPVYPVFDFVLVLAVLFAAAFTTALYRLYKGIKLG